MDIFTKESIVRPVSWEELRHIPAVEAAANSPEELKELCPLVISELARVTFDDYFELRGDGYTLSRILHDSDLQYNARFSQVRTSVDWAAVSLLLRIAGYSGQQADAICEASDLPTALKLLGIEE